MSRLILALVAALLAFPNVGYAAIAVPEEEPRCVALVIGNNAYEHVPELNLAVNDATAVGEALARLGFSVHRLLDADHGTLRHGLRDFAAEAAGAEMSVVFFAGHGLGANAQSYLVPVDARLARPIDVELGTVPVDLLVDVIEDTAGYGLIVLDAEFRSIQFGEERSTIAPIAPDFLRSDRRAIAYATKPGMAAFEDEGPNSPFTTSLLSYIEEPGLDIGLMFRMVRGDVLRATEGKQEPHLGGALPARPVYLAQPARAEGESEARCGEDWLGSEEPGEGSAPSR